MQPLNSILYLGVSHKLERGVNMTWREGSNQAGFSIIGLHKIHHDDIPQVLTEKTGTGAKGMCPQYAQGSFLRLDYIVLQKYSVHCNRSRKRLRWQLQTFETAVANVCDRGCKRLRFSSTNVRVTRPSVS